MSAIPTRNLLALLGRLETALVEQGMARPEDFPRGLDGQAIRGRTAMLALELPEDLQSLYQWHDGMRGGEFLPGLTFNPLEVAIRRYEVWIERFSGELGPWEPGWLPIFESGGCTSFVRCGAVERGGLWYLCPEVDELGWLADSIGDWVEWCVRAYEDGAVYIDPKRGRSIDAQKSAAILRDLDPTPPNVESLVDALIGDNQMLRAKARDRLIAYRYAEAVKPVLRLLEADQHDVVGDAARILASSGLPETVAPMIEVAARWERRRGNLDNPVLYRLSGYGQEIVELLTGALSGGDDKLRAAAATCLGALGDARAFPALHAALSDRSPQVRAAVRKAIARMQRKQL